MPNNLTACPALHYQVGYSINKEEQQISLRLRVRQCGDLS